MQPEQLREDLKIEFTDFQDTSDTDRFHKEHGRGPYGWVQNLRKKEGDYYFDIQWEDIGLVEEYCSNVNYGGSFLTRIKPASGTIKDFLLRGEKVSLSEVLDGNN